MGRKKKAVDDTGRKPDKRIAVLVPAYKEDQIIKSTAENLLRLDYPAALYRIYIIADSFEQTTISHLRQLNDRLTVLPVSFDKSTKTKSLNKAFEQITELFDIALICDADNMLAHDFLKRIDAAFSNGARAVQGRRVAKNLDSSFAVLDACSEGVNNNIFRKGPYLIGMSSAVIGSGMAFEFSALKDILGKISAVGGFDKILQLRIVESGIRIHYLEGALVFDEKVSNSGAFEGQRQRWVSSQFQYLRRFFASSFSQLFRGNISYFNLAFLNNIILPRAILVLLLVLTAVSGFFWSIYWGVAGLALLVVYIGSLFLAIPGELFNKELFRAFYKLPRAIIIMVGTLFHIRKANKTFIHTVHTKTEVSSTLYDEKEK
ncbi:MAG TPA: glycosyltransferase family 2 protein [Chitinophagaceae bacterium]|nr:glycosyltransferase family 2 protein [Chitinophagaceae bacterium]